MAALEKGSGEHKIEALWYEARDLHFPLDNATVNFDGSDLVGIQLWGAHGNQWCMKKPPADWEPRVAAGLCSATETSLVAVADNEFRRPDLADDLRAFRSREGGHGL